MKKPRERIISIMRQWLFENCKCRIRSAGNCQPCVEVRELENFLTRPSDDTAAMEDDMGIGMGTTVKELKKLIKICRIQAEALDDIYKSTGDYPTESKIAKMRVQIHQIAGEGGKLLKVQVKSNAAAKIEGENCKDPAWRFRLVNGGDKTGYQPGQVDLFACVAIPTGEIAYLVANETKEISMTFMQSSSPKRYRKTRHLTDYPLSLALAKIKGAA